MKREHNIISESNPLMSFLNAHNCIFYTPLSQTDTSDWISGNAMQLYNANSAVWDSAKNMWKFQYASNPTGGTNAYYAKWSLKELLSMSPPVFSAVAELYCYSATNNGNVSNYNLSNNSSGAGLTMYGTQNQLTQSCQQFYTSNNATIQRHVMNGNIAFEYNYNQLINLPDMLYVDIGWDMRYNQTYRRGPWGMRNFAVFNSVLSVDEINEYFNIITA